MQMVLSESLLRHVITVGQVTNSPQQELRATDDDVISPLCGIQALGIRVAICDMCLTNSVHLIELGFPLITFDEGLASLGVPAAPDWHCGSRRKPEELLCRS